jgi:hypothetical protein
MRGHRWRVYINPFDIYGQYSGYVEVTDDVEMGSIGAISQDLDNADYSIGIYRSSNLSLILRNESGKYSDVGTPTSMFRYKRGDSLVKITWSNETGSNKCGWITAGGSVVAPETDIFIGLINDDSLSVDLDTRKLSFTVMGRESMLSRAAVPFSSIVIAGQSVAISIASPGVFTTPLAHGLQVGNPISFSTTGTLPSGLTGGTPYYVSAVPTSTTFRVSSSLGGSDVDTSGSQSGTHSMSLLFGPSISSVIYTCLNQSAITGLLAVALSNISVGTDCAIDSLVDLQNKTVWQALSDLLLLSNSVLYVSGGAIIVSPRTPTASVLFNFYGQASISGPENVQNIRSIKNGMSRVFNYISWDPSQVFAQDSSSVSKYGARTKQFDQTQILNPTNQQTILTNILNEFSLPKQEFDLYTPLTYGSLSLELLSRVSIDYPPMALPGNNPLPICGVAICGQAVTPSAVWSFTAIPNENYKVIGKSIDPKSAMVKLKMRQV